MIGDPRDRTAYGLAIASLGLALVALIVGICWIGTEDNSATSGATTADTPTAKCRLGDQPAKCGAADPKDQASEVSRDPQASEIPKELWAALAAIGGVLVGLLIPFPLSAWQSGPWSRERGWSLAVAVAVLLAGALLVTFSPELSLTRIGAGALLLGLLIPSPARGE